MGVRLVTRLPVLKNLINELNLCAFASGLPDISNFLLLIHCPDLLYSPSILFDVTETVGN